jgi:hypothetical protein
MRGGAAVCSARVSRCGLEVPPIRYVYVVGPAKPVGRPVFRPKDLEMGMC